MRGERDHEQVALMAAVLAIVAWGFGPLFVRGIHADAPVIVLWRILVALPVAIAVAHLTGGRITWSLVRQAYPTAVCFALSVITAFASFRETTIADATLIPALQPVFVLVIASRLFGERRSTTEIVAAGVAFAGVGAVVAGSTGGHRSTYGDVLAVGNLLTFTAYFLLAKRIRTGDVHSWSFLAAIFIGTATIVVPWSLLVSDSVAMGRGADWLLVLALVFIPGMVGHGFMTWAHHYVDVSVTSMLTLANPVISIAGAWVVFSQSLTLVQIAGGAAVLGALAVIIRRQRADRALALEATLARDPAAGSELGVQSCA
ncbi:MAG TPA: DMT family transporter [Acidimicrobiales bacterium]|nr:DMT family transporter [Acidimicrobiales bacterium]